MSDPYQYIVLHGSLRYNAGIVAVQAAHAAGESCFDGPAPKETRVVALVAESAQDLIELAGRLQEAGIPHALICEPDEPYYGSATAVGVSPCERDRIRPFVEQFKILR